MTIPPVRSVLERPFGTTPRSSSTSNTPSQGTALDDHLRKEQSRAVLELLADYKRKLDKNGDAQS
jgi:hypothetical protein